MFCIQASSCEYIPTGTKGELSKMSDGVRRNWDSSVLLNCQIILKSPDASSAPIVLEARRSAPTLPFLFWCVQGLTERGKFTVDLAPNALLVFVTVFCVSYYWKQSSFMSCMLIGVRAMLDLRIS